MSIKKIVASAGIAAGAIAAMAGTANAAPAQDLMGGVDNLATGVETLAGATDFAGSTVVNTFADRLGVTHYVNELKGR